MASRQSRVRNGDVIHRILAVTDRRLCWPHRRCPVARPGRTSPARHVTSMGCPSSLDWKSTHTPTNKRSRPPPQRSLMRTKSESLTVCAQLHKPQMRLESRTGLPGRRRRRVAQPCRRFYPLAQEKSPGAICWPREEPGHEIHDPRDYLPDGLTCAGAGVIVGSHHFGRSHGGTDRPNSAWGACMSRGPSKKVNLRDERRPHSSVDSYRRVRGLRSLGHLRDAWANGAFHRPLIMTVTMETA
jgi:hypothetical protein